MSALLNGVAIGADTYLFEYDAKAGVSRMFTDAGVELCMGCGEPVDLCECESELAADPED